MNWPLSYDVMVVISYLLGSIPFGFLLTKYAGLGDIRQIGSGNIGATNVLRTGNKKLALATLLLDAIKGVAAMALSYAFGLPGAAPFAGVAAVVGHIFPLWLKGKGGKGVATALGVMLVLHWPSGGFACIAWIAVFLLTRYSSLSSLSAMAAGSVAAFIFSSSLVFYCTFGIAILVILRHHQNIKRLLRREEPKSSFRKRS